MPVCHVIKHKERKMRYSKKIGIAGTVACLIFTACNSESAFAGPIRVVRSDLLIESSMATEVRYRRRVRRGAIGPGAVLGLFGALIGGAIASSRYNNYSDYAYGQPYGYDYGYAPGYSGGAVFGGGRVRNGGARGPRFGGGVAHIGRAGGVAHTPGTGVHGGRH